MTGLLPKCRDIAIAQAIRSLLLEFERIQFLLLTAEIVHASCVQVGHHKIERRVVLDSASDLVDFFEDDAICVCDLVLRNEGSLQEMVDEGSS